MSDSLILSSAEDRAIYFALMIVRHAPRKYLRHLREDDKEASLVLLSRLPEVNPRSHSDVDTVDMSEHVEVEAPAWARALPIRCTRTSAGTIVEGLTPKYRGVLSRCLLAVLRENEDELRAIVGMQAPRLASLLGSLQRLLAKGAESGEVPQ